MKLIAGAPSAPRVESRAHFFAIAARAMRQILVDHARGRNRLKRGGGNEGRRVPLTDLESPADAELDLGELDEALTRLAATDPVGAQVTEMRFFGGMEMQDIATVLGTTDRTARRHWVFAKAWLCRELTGEERS
jgi:RNA polymerase sigma factor (TIGR02999 family)